MRFLRRLWRRLRGYRIGERGPEVFRPETDGFILPPFKRPSAEDRARIWSVWCSDPTVWDALETVPDVNERLVRGRKELDDGERIEFEPA